MLLYIVLGLVYVIIWTQAVDVWNAVFRDSDAIVAVAFAAVALAVFWPLTLPIGLLIKRHRLV